MRREAGFSLLESSAAVGLTSIVLIVVGNVIVGSTASTSAIVRDSNASAELQRSLDTLRAELHESAPAQVSVDSSGTNDSVVLRTAGPLAGSQPTWGARDDDGTWHDGWTARYRVAGTSFVRESLDIAGAVQGDGVTLAVDVDAPLQGEKGLTISRAGPVIRIDLRVRKVLRDGAERRESLGTSVLLRNTAD